eukprot:TRINITY_DN1665_c0_g1_i1.p1 TRINITY_DN1665_c0_g1~~TRINITY_DN1665_c0_g1_i1.p1  ORF type:complete len:202 (+),score=52.03 TRINITY_DN1665_c0_g1_i1:119-724(+)
MLLDFINSSTGKIILATTGCFGFCGFVLLFRKSTRKDDKEVIDEIFDKVKDTFGGVKEDLHKPEEKKKEIQFPDLATVNDMMFSLERTTNTMYTQQQKIDQQRETIQMLIKKAEALEEKMEAEHRLLITVECDHQIFIETIREKTAEIEDLKGEISKTKMEIQKSKLSSRNFDSDWTVSKQRSYYYTNIESSSDDYATYDL